MGVILPEILCQSQIKFYAKDAVNDFIWISVNQNKHQ